MSRDHTQEALDEYYSTGIDPTGGDIGPASQDNTEQSFDEDSSTDDGFDRLVHLVDQKISEVDCLSKQQQLQEEKPSAVPALKKFSWGGLIWEVAIIAFFIVMLILLLK